MNVEEWLGADNKFGLDIWHQKYQYNNETFDEWLDRVCNGNEEIKKLIVAKKFIFGGRILSNRGLQKKGKKITYSNCFNLGEVGDTLEEIFDIGKKMAKTYAAGGGCGINLSKLRPRGSAVHNNAKYSTGAVSFMEMYSKITETIGQENRRGALMITLASNHPDIEEFIKSKSDLTKITKANISMWTDDAFMQAVVDDTDYELYFKVEQTGEEIRKTVRAKDILKMIAQQSWKTGEPGMLFKDRIQKYNLMENIPEFNITGTNPCLTGDMKILTTSGYVKISYLDGQEVDLINKDGIISRGKVWNNGEKPTVKILMSNGDFITCTNDHKFMDINENVVEAKHLKGNRIMPFLSVDNDTFDKEYVKYGFLQGDGNLTRLNSVSHKGLEVNLGINDDDVRQFFNINKNGRKVYINGYNETLKNLGFYAKTLPTRELPTTINNWNNKQILSFLKGLYSANGSVLSNGRITLKTTCKYLAESIQILLDKYNIVSYITTNKARNTKFNNGEYTCKESYDINIQQYNSRKIFFNNINFIQKYKTEKLKNILINSSPVVINVKNTGATETVYDFSEPMTHWGVVKGFVTHNCGELPLPSMGACLLSSMNLSEYVINPFKDNNYFDYSSFRLDVMTAVKAMNECLDENAGFMPLPEQTDAVDTYRPIGLGIFGLADMFIKMNVRYGGEESLKIIGNICSELAYSAIVGSSEWGKSKPQVENLERIFSSTYYESIIGDIKYLPTNCQILTIAPTGTVSNMFGVSGGGEPLYAASMKRKTESLNGGVATEYIINAKVVDEWLKENNETVIPKWIEDSTAMNLNWEDRVRFQSTLQHYIDNAISSTVNLPNSATEEDIMNVYINAWKSGCKGITVFRDGCDRAGILSTKVEDENEGTKPISVVTIGENQVIKAGTLSSGSIQLNQDDDWEDDEKIYLTWGETIDPSDNLIGIKRKIVSGCGNIHAQFFFDWDGEFREVYLDKGSTGGCAAFMGALSRMISIGARTGVSFDKIVDQLNSVFPCPSYVTRTAVKGDTSKGKNCPNAIGNALIDAKKEVDSILCLDGNKKDKTMPSEDIREYHDSKEKLPLKTEQECIDENICPICYKQGTVEYLSASGGCRSCQLCGWSRCE